MGGRRQGMGRIRVGVALTVGALIGGAGCGGGGQGSPPTAIGTDAGGSNDPTGGACGTTKQAADLCAAVATGTVTACGQGSDGQPSQTGYLEIAMPGASRVYTCATSWAPGGSGGYWFDQPGQFMSDPQSCCGGAATPVAAPTAPKLAAGYLGAPHAPRDIKPQESAQPGAGPIKQDPFAVVVTAPGGAAAFQAALANWNAWVGDGNAHPAPDGSGSYFFAALLINYAVLATSDGQAVVVVGPEVSVTADGLTPLGHPTLGVCPTGGGAPLVLMAGELSGTELSNHSGRYGHDTSVTQEALDNAAKLFNCVGIPVTSTTYYPPKP